MINKTRKEAMEDKIELCVQLLHERKHIHERVKDQWIFATNYFRGSFYAWGETGKNGEPDYFTHDELRHMEAEAVKRHNDKYGAPIGINVFHSETFNRPARVKHFA